MKVSIIVAVSTPSRAIGKANTLLWRLPDDLKRFKKLTTGHPIIMGRKTHESIGRILPNRLNIIISRNPDFSVPGATIAHSLDEALEIAKATGTEEAFIIGGAQIYAEALPRADKLYITVVDREYEADAFFPPYEYLFTKKVSEEARSTEDGLNYRYLTLER